ncbi:hypothetical protein GCM10017778_68700 [Streptomyces vinaceus]|nr:hypothetical protein GCM10017778_68700 [Streptomyces vinaceus]
MLRNIQDGAFLLYGRGVRAEPLRVETFTGSRMDRFEKLLRVVRERAPGRPGHGVCRRRIGCCWWRRMVPVRDRTVAASSRNYRSAPGNKVDARVWRESDHPAKRRGRLSSQRVSELF